MTASPQEFCEAARTKHLQGRAAEAERLYREALRLEPDHANSLEGLGVLLLQGGRLDQAVDFLCRAASLSGAAPTYNNLGVALSAAGRYEGAAQAYRNALKVEPASLEALINLGSVLNLLGRSADAVSVLRKAVSLDPQSAGANHRLGIALMESGRPDDAVAHLDKALVREPQNTGLYNDIGSVLLRLGRHSEAADRFRQALGLDPRSVRALCGLGDALGALDRHEEALTVFERALALAPDNALVHYDRGTALTFLGRLEEAQGAFARAAALATDVPLYRYALMTTRRATSEDLEALQVMAAKPAARSEREQAQLHLALAKAYDDLGIYESAFRQFEQGNAIKRKLVAYDERNEISLLRGAAHVFTGDYMAANAECGDPSEVPIFIFGFPRSGTTLVEQILASHPAVFGAGEQTFLPNLAQELAPQGSRRGEDWRGLGERYVAKLRALAPRAARITDKLPGNFAHAGLIHLALPRARIIHVRRDPLDTCFSCFTKLFDGDIPYAYDLGELGRYYQAYDELMAHWRRILPARVLLEVRYEGLIGGFEQETRRMLDHCRLPWSEACRDFHRSRRMVRTASAAQVRRPLYGDAVGRAAPYAAWLGPLRAALAGEP